MRFLVIGESATLSGLSLSDAKSVREKRSHPLGLLKQLKTKRNNEDTNKVLLNRSGNGFRVCNELGVFG